MNELIKITEKNGKQLVSGRELHEFLEVKVHFSTWFNRMSEYGFEEDIDFSVLKSGNPGGGIAKIDDYIITIDMAKEISMLQRTDKGKQARRYFIECEKQLRESRASFMIEDPIERAKAWIREQEQLKAEKEAERLEKERLQIQLDNSKEYYTIKRVAHHNNMSWKDLDWRALKRASNLMGIVIIKVFDANYGEVNAYHKDVFKEVYPMLSYEDLEGGSI